MIQKRERKVEKQARIDQNWFQIMEEKALETKYLNKVRDQMQNVATK